MPAPLAPLRSQVTYPLLKLTRSQGYKIMLSKVLAFPAGMSHRFTLAPEATA